MSVRTTEESRARLYAAAVRENRSPPRPPGFPPRGFDRDTSHLLGGQFAVMRSLAEGSFGAVYVARNLSGGQEVAVKFERYDAKHAQVNREGRCLVYLQKRDIPPGLVPRVCMNSEEPGKCRFLVMDRLGSSLRSLLEANGGTFSMPTVLQLAIGMLTALREVHRRHIIHRDIKPDNFVMGPPGPYQRSVHLIDFGMMKRYIHEATGEHVEERHDHKLMGTPRYLSVNCHLGVTPSRRDDFVSVCYVLIFMATGSLPWIGSRKKGEQDYSRMLQMKQAYGGMDLCQRMGLPECIGRTLEHGMGLGFAEEPNYDACIASMARQLEGGGYDDVSRTTYDWERVGAPN